MLASDPLSGSKAKTQALPSRVPDLSVSVLPCLKAAVLQDSYVAGKYLNVR